MIVQLVSIEEVGRFEQYKKAGNHANLEQFTVVFAENGRGKSTLAAILRSLGSRDPAFIAERRRLGGQEPRVEVMTRSGSVTYAEGAWKGPACDVRVFDDRFVNDNVFAGLDVSVDQRRGLHQLIVGRDGVDLARRVVDLDEDLRRLGTHQRDLQAKIQDLTRVSIPVTDFCGLVPWPDTEQRLDLARRELAAHDEADAILKQDLFAPLPFPAFDDVALSRLTDVLAKTISDLDREAEDQVKTHVARLGGVAAEAWLSQGVQMQQADVCPYCLRAMSGLALLQAYRGHFGAAYQACMDRLRKWQARVEERFGPLAASEFRRAVESTDRCRAFWSKHTRLPGGDLAVERWCSALTEMHRELGEALRAKAADPLGVVKLTATALETIRTCRVAASEVMDVQDALLGTNAALADLKRRVAGGDRARLAREVEMLEAMKKRSDAAVSRLCQDLQAVVTERGLLTEEKKVLQERLDAYTTEVFPRLQGKVNAFLRAFGANFEIGALKDDHAGGKPTSSYHVFLNEEKVKLARPKSPAPSFSTTLSGGDRRTLALAFFLTTVSCDPSKQDLVVVLDDAVSSLDDHRTSQTVRAICSLSKQVAQVVVLSHSASFLRRVWDASHGVQKGATSIVLENNSSTFREWAIEAETAADHQRLRETLVDH